MKNVFLRMVLSAFAGVLLFAATAPVANAGPITQLAFIVDASGSIGTSNFASMRTSLANALNVLPTNSTVEVTVIRFSSSAAVIQSPTLINSAATLTAVQNAILAMTYPGGSTDTAAAINLATSQLTGSPNFATPGSRQVFNILTDGVPDSQSGTVAAATAAVAAGIDEIDLEAIGSNINLTQMLQIARPSPGHLTTDPQGFAPGFVLPVAQFGAELDDAIAAKLRAVLNPEVPEPASVTIFGLMAAGGAFYGWRRRKQAMVA